MQSRRKAKSKFAAGFDYHGQSRRLRGKRRTLGHKHNPVGGNVGAISGEKFINIFPFANNKLEIGLLRLKYC